MDELLLLSCLTICSFLLMFALTSDVSGRLMLTRCRRGCEKVFVNEKLTKRDRFNVN